MKPWGKQQSIQHSEELIIKIEEIITLAQSIINKRTQCLFVLLYLTGCRICELIRKDGYDLQLISKEKVDKKYKYKYNKIRNKEKDRPSIKRRQISFEIKNNRECILIHIRNEKHKQKKTKEIPIPLDRNENIVLVNLISNYLNNLNGEDELFPFKYQYAYKLLKPYFNPHWFRHIRATHLTVEYNLPVHLLRKYMGWTDDRPSKHYQELRWDDILDKL